MSKPAASHPDPNTQEWMGALVRVGLAEFSTQFLKNPDPLATALTEEAHQILGQNAELCWDDLRARTACAWPAADCALSRLISDFDLNPAEAFLLSLVGEVETSHLINVVLAQLQAPAAAHRPSVHLSLALIESLFGQGTMSSQDFHDLRLVQAHILELEGDGPLPLRTLRVLPSLWAVLSSRPTCWPDCSFVPPGDTALVTDQLIRDLPKIADLLQRGETHGLVLRGTPNSGRKQFTSRLAAAMGLRALEVPVPVWEKEPALSVACRYAKWLPVLSPSLGPGEVWRMPRSGQPADVMAVLLGMDGAVETEQLMELDLPLPTEAERRAIWSRYVNNSRLAAQAAATALLSGPAIQTVAKNAQLIAARASEPVSIVHVAESRRQLGAERLRLLAQPVHRRVTSASLVLPPLLTREIDGVIQRSRLRESLWRGLGVTLQATRNLGVRVLFVGESGTGKTLAASYVATALGAPLYRVDLAAVMNKYIGESEKNLATLLDQAAASDVILLFDEADSLFGRRTEGKETGERYANMLTNFLLTRIENHPGIVILTTNSRERIDSAFTRRLDVIAEFPLPGYEERLQLWQSHLGERGPGDKTNKYLASYCDFAGGQIRNVVLTAATLANERHIGTAELMRGLESEYRKLGRSLPTKLAQMAGVSSNTS